MSSPFYDVAIAAIVILGSLALGVVIAILWKLCIGLIFILSGRPMAQASTSFKVHELVILIMVFGSPVAMLLPSICVDSRVPLETDLRNVNVPPNSGSD